MTKTGHRRSKCWWILVDKTEFWKKVNWEFFLHSERCSNWNWGKCIICFGGWTPLDTMQYMSVA